MKQREDSAEQYAKGGRPELADKERAEIVVLKAYLPAEASEEDVARAVDQAVTETGASSPKDMGKVMKALMPEVQGRAEGSAVSELVKARLSGK